MGWGRVDIDCLSWLYIVCKTRPYKISVNQGKFQVDVGYLWVGRVDIDCLLSLYFVCKTRPYKISVNQGKFQVDVGYLWGGAG